ncbi:HupE/UreJ family protein [Variovorax ureilyticus]|uniref:HupE/UreJ family protein n=1 Tax=Variovorax ureilyticus TaxID=1836198 RepID=A0ABU8VPR4_9BURK
MFTKTLIRPFALAVLLATAASASQAHPGHGTEGLAAGLAHPFMGMDHLLAMVAVGLWSTAALPEGRRHLGPVVFMASLLVGATLALAGWELPMVEAGVAASVLLLAALMLGARRIPSAIGLTMVALAALLHGHAHGSELAAGHSFGAYAAGFLATSALLHGIGLAAGRALHRLPGWVWRAAAALMASGGVLMLAGRL